MQKQKADHHGCDAHHLGHGIMRELKHPKMRKSHRRQQQRKPAPSRPCSQQPQRQHYSGNGDEPRHHTRGAGNSKKWNLQSAKKRSPHQRGVVGKAETTAMHKVARLCRVQSFVGKGTTRMHIHQLIRIGGKKKQMPGQHRQQQQINEMLHEFQH